MAAGESKRLGRHANKLRLEFAGQSLLQRALDVASRSQAMTCTLVVGADAERVLDAIDLRRCVVVYNHVWAEGIASSIRAGLAFHEDDEACCFMVADQPFISVEDVNRVIAHHLASRQSIIALQAGDVWGTPVLFPAHDFASLSKLHGDKGAKRYAEQHLSRVRFVAALSKDAFLDVDTKEDYERLLLSERKNPRIRRFQPPQFRRQR
jgi:CTP:molybdopterin cytidylyltransferase MocA